MPRGGRRNGSGRPIGAVSEENKLRQEMRRRIVELAHDRADELFSAVMDLATGCYEEKAEEGRMIRVYKRKPDNRSIQWLLEQVAGRSPQQIDLNTNEQTFPNLKIEFVESPNRKSEVKNELENI